jgi:sulfotransferase
VKKFIFIAGLPRSGSTLLSGILRQNPDFHASMSGPALPSLAALQKSLSHSSEFGVNVSDEQRRNVFRGVLENFYQTHPQRVIFDTNRGWTGKTATIADLFPDAKIICLVRPVIEILESFERAVRANHLSTSRIFAPETELNVYSRVDSLLLPTGQVGSALNGLKDAFYGPQSDRLMVIAYDRLVSSPEQVMSALYDFIGESPFTMSSFPPTLMTRIWA